MELKLPGSTLAQAIETVGRNSATFRAYLSFSAEEAANIRLILMDRKGISPDEEASDQEVQGGPASPSLIYRMIRQ